MRYQSRSLLILGILFTLCGALDVMAQDRQYEFGAAPYFKNYPEFKRGPDPWANLSGTLQENVDTYGGKLNLTFPLPGIPWSEKTSFAPVLQYNSNIWSYLSPTAKSSIGGDPAKPEQVERPELRIPRTKIPDYWYNDAWVRFSPIGRPHNMPGWTLAIGGVYTEYTAGSGPISWVEYPPNCLVAVMEKKYFIAPDGSSHLLVDTQTNNRPYFSFHPTGERANPSTPYCTKKCKTIPLQEPTNLCMPDRETAPEGERVWRAVDGSGYYYVESLHAVFGKDGTEYTLSTEAGSQKGMITAITDLDGNTITITYTDTNPSNPHAGEKILTYKSENTHAELNIYFTKKQLENYTPNYPAYVSKPVDIVLLDRLTVPGVGGGTITYRFNDGLDDYDALLKGPGTGRITFTDLFSGTLLNCPGDISPVDLGARIFSDPAAPSAQDQRRNSQIFLLRHISLPDGRRFQFEYDQAGKICKITYPDGGFREYQYANTIDPSTSSVDCLYPGSGKEAGMAPLGGVGLVSRGEPGKPTQVERAYAYSGFNVVEKDADDPQAVYVETLVWYGDQSVQILKYYPSEQIDENRHILQFGMPLWSTGKLKKTCYYDFTSITPNVSGFKKYFLGLEADNSNKPQMYLIQDVRNFIFPSGRFTLLKEEETVYDDNQHGSEWHWQAPTNYCTITNCQQWGPSGAFSGLIPPDVSGWSTSPYSEFYLPEWNTVVREKIERVRGSGNTLVRRTVLNWGDVLQAGTDLWEYNANLASESEYLDGANVYRKKEYEYQHYWNAQPVAGMPARVLNLATMTTVQDAAQTVISKIQNDYNEFDSRADFHPKWTATWIDENSIALSSYTYGTPAPHAAVRLMSVSNRMNNQVDGETVTPGLIQNTVRFDYDGMGLLHTLKASEADFQLPALTMTLDYDSSTGLLLRRMDRNGDRNGNLVIDSGDDRISFAYDPYNRLSSVSLLHGTAPAETLASYVYSPADERYQVERTDNLDGGSKRRIATVRNDAFGRAADQWTTVAERDDIMRETYTHKTFDILGRPAEEFLPQETDFECDPYTQVCLHETKSGGFAITYTYDALGRTLTVNSPKPDFGTFTVSTTYLVEPGNLESETVTEQIASGDNRWRKIWKDALGRIVQVDECKPDGSAGSWMTNYGYDRLDHLLQVDKRNAEGGSGQVRTFTYDWMGKMLSATLPEYDSSMHYEYDDLGNLIHKWMANSPQSYDETMSYDPLGRLEDRIVQLQGESDTPLVKTFHHFEYDQVSPYGDFPATPPAGYPGAYSWGRVVRDRAQYDDQEDDGNDTGGVAIERFYRYDWKGQLTGKSEVLGTRDEDGTVTGDTFETTYDEYDRLGNLVKMTYPSGLTAGFTYANGGSLAEVGVNGAAILSSLRYAANGAPDRMTLSAGGGSVDWARKFNIRFWPEKIVVGAGVEPDTYMEQANVLFGLMYPPESYEGNGNIKEMWRFRREQAGMDQDWLGGTYAYDRLNRLASARISSGVETQIAHDQTYTYTMDEFGNVLAQTAPYPGDPTLPKAMSVSVSPATNRLTTSTYDLLGNQTQLDRPEGQSDLRLVYQDQGHIYEVRDAAGTTVLYRYYYDTDGKRRIEAKADAAQRTVREDTSDPNHTRYYLVDDCSFSFYEGEDLICQQDQAELIVDDELGQPSADYYGTKFLLLDHLGTTRAELTFPSGTPTVEQVYDTMPFGELMNGPSMPDERVIYTGKSRDVETGADVFRARFYIGTQFRWISSDQPFLDSATSTPQSWNLYMYARNNPIFFFDPNGESTHTDVAGNVIWVSNDGDNGIYMHSGKEVKAMMSGKEAMISKGVKMGETYFWDEFINPDTGKIFKNAKVNFGQSWEPLISKQNAESKKMTLVETMFNELPGRKFDIKSFGNPNEGRLLDGKYVTLRSAGNFLAAYNARTGVQPFVFLPYFAAYYQTSYQTFMSIAGFLHSKSLIDQFKPPYYGENEYCGRMTKKGWEYRK